MFKKFLVLSILFGLLFITVRTKAQTQGCLIGGQLYVYNTSGTLVPTACGWYTPKVGNSTWSNSRKNMCTGDGGTHGEWLGKACPIDDYIPLFGFVLAGFSIYFLRKKNLLLTR